MTPLRQRMIEDMQLRGLAPATQRAYLGAIQQLACHYGTSPDQLSEEAIRRYFLFLYREKHISRSTATVTLCAIKFLFEQTLRRTFALFDLMRPGTDQKLPVVLTPDETWRILALVRKPAYQACLSTIYTCGLRISEGIDLQVSHIDSARMSLHIHAGKGNKDRLVPLPARTLTLLRTQWQTHRNPVWIFPAADRGDIASSTASTPIDAVTVRRAFSAAVAASGIAKSACVHTLRHSWATHLLESGVSLRVIQTWLGHTSPTTTARYTHLTQKIEQQATTALELLTAGMP